MKVAVIGAGGWGTALAMLLARNGSEVTLWGRDSGFVRTLESTRENVPYLPGVILPHNIALTSNLGDVSKAPLALIVTPSIAIRSISEKLADIGLSNGTVLLSCTKGIEFDSGKRMTQILSEYFPANPVAVLSGPSHAEEVAREQPTAVVLGASDHDVAVELQRHFSSPNFRAYTSQDVDGIELGGALKNIFAIAAGISDGIGLGDNTKAALVTRALTELIRLGVALGGKRETFQGLSGIGDLMVTCFSRHSRNRRFGERLGRGETLAVIQAGARTVAEGVPTTKSAFQCARREKITTPIIDEMYSILYEGTPPSVALKRLLTRDPRPEADDRSS
ncbi:MAG TPA: NAD(P)H-dependent glycerol-3-phosphate dehydrogenase [Chthoniobacterales bacterium]